LLIFDTLDPTNIRRGESTMIRFLLGVIVGILLFLFFLYFGGGKTVRTIGEGLSDTGKKMEVMEETIKKEKEGIGSGIKKKFFKEERQIPKKSQ
jgi:hypothetical protein